MRRQVKQQPARRQAAAPAEPALPRTSIADDCRHFNGDRPCRFNRLCRGCEHYAPYSSRICIIKLGALGDVIRTLCILPELRRRYPDAHITWVSKPNGCRMIGEHPLIDRVVPFDAITCMTLQNQVFDVVICLDKEAEPAALATSIYAETKLGVGLSTHGKPVPLNREARHYFKLGLSDELKFCLNEKSYPQLVYEAFGWTYRGQRYELPLNESAADRVRLSLASRGWKPHQPTLGVFVGAGRAFANKMWQPHRISQTICQLKEKDPHLQIMLLGGPDERETIDRIMSDLYSTGKQANVIDTGTQHDEPTFIALVDTLDVLFCGDTMAMHVAIALNKGVVVYFGPTCEQEIDLFARGEKLVADVPCGPCYKRVCDKNDICVNQIATEEAVEAISRVLKQVRNEPLPLNEYLPMRKAG